MDADKKLLEAFMYEKEYMLASELVEKYRVISTGNITGAFSFKYSPWARQVVNTIMPECPYRVVGLQGSSQVGKTISLANTMLAVFKQLQANMLFMSHTKDEVKDAMTGFIDEMIRESGISNTIGRPKKGSSRKSGSGDTDFQKKFGDGVYTLYTRSGQNVAKLSSITPKYSFNDEVDRYKNNTKTGGDAYSLIMNRHKTFGSFYKAYFYSTPELAETSIIEPIFLQGDQNYYHIPCPHCGEYIKLEWTIKTESGDYAGITYKRTNVGGLEPKTVGYVCQKCGGYFKERHKFEMFDQDNENQRYDATIKKPPLCLWIPSATPIEPDYGSFHINTLYSGEGMCSWDDMAKNWCAINPINAPKKVEALKTFYNQMLGLTWKDTFKQIDATGLMKNQRNYDAGFVPDNLSKEDGNGDIILLVCAVDLNGIMDEKNPENDDVRLNYTVTAYTESGNEDFHTSYEVMHGAIGEFERAGEARERLASGATRNDKMTYRMGVPNSVWDVFEKDVLLRQWITQSGKVMRIMLCGVDTGNYTIYANAFVQKHKHCIGLKGGRTDEFAKDGDIKPYVLKTEQPQLWKVDGNRLKDRVAESIDATWDKKNSLLQPVGHFNFPMAKGDLYTRESYFIEYEGEKRSIVKNSIGSPIGWLWTKKHSESRQHYFDCRVYSEALVKIAMRIWCAEAKTEYTYKNFVSLMKLISKR